MMREFSLFLAQVKTVREADRVLQDLHASIAMSIASSRAARLRVISVSDGRSMTEFSWSKDPSSAIPGISNGWLKEETGQREFSEATVLVRSDNEILDQRCIFVAVSDDPGSCDRELLRSLVNQFHLLYVLSRLIFGKSTSPKKALREAL